MLPNLLYALHVLGAALWVGMMLFSIVVLAPAMGVLQPGDRLALGRGVSRRFLLVVWHAMPIVLATGYALLFGWYGGFAGAGWHVHVMHLTGLIMGAVFLVVALGPGRSLQAPDAEPAALAATAARIRRLVTLNLVLGILTVAVAAWGRFG